MKKLIILLSVLLLPLLTFTACGGNDYNAVLYSHAEEQLDEEFLKEYRVKAYYPNENYIEGESEPSEKYLYGETLPSSLTVIFTEQEKFNKINTNDSLTVDFENEFIIFYFFPDVYPDRKYNLDRIVLKEQILNIYCELEDKDVNDAVMPYQRCLMVKLNKIKYIAINFILIK